MAKSKRKGMDFDRRPLMKEVGLKKYLEVVPVRDVIDFFGAKNIIKELGIERILHNLSAEKRKKLKELLKQQQEPASE